MSTAKQQQGAIGSGKIDRVVILFKENHTFDNYFGTFSGANGMNMPRSPNPLHGIPTTGTVHG
jgi:phospholipase C